MATALTIGTFDPIHLGHLGLFSQCRKIVGQTGRVVVGVNSDKFIEEYKGKKPLLSLETRLGVISQLTNVDAVFTNYGGKNQAELINYISPEFLVIGLDWATKDYYGQLGVSSDWLEERGIQLLYVPRTGHWSSSQMKNDYR